MKPKPWTLPRVLAANRAAAAVYLAVLWLAGERRQVCTTRARIKAVCGLCPETITGAVQALNDAGWIKLAYGRAAGKRWYRLTLPKLPPFPWAEKTRSREPKLPPFPWAEKTRSREASKTGKNPLKGTPRLSGKNPPYSLKRVGAGPVAALPLRGDTATPAGTPDTGASEEGAMVSVADLAAEVFGGQQ